MYPQPKQCMHMWINDLKKFKKSKIKKFCLIPRYTNPKNLQYKAKELCILNENIIHNRKTWAIWAPKSELSNSMCQKFIRKLVFFGTGNYSMVAQIYWVLKKFQKNCAQMLGNNYICYFP
jgi:hypothetical protein